MKRWLSLSMIFLVCVNCSTLRDLLKRKEVVEAPKKEEPAPEPQPTRTTARSLEEQSLLGEGTGSLWVARGQSSYLFANNNRRLIGDLVNVQIEGYPKEQIQTKVNVISKLLAKILSEEKEEIHMLQEEIKNQQPQPQTDDNVPNQQPVNNRGLASTPEDPTADMDEEQLAAYRKKQEELKKQQKENAKRLANIGDEQEEIKQLMQAKDFPIQLMPTRITEIHRNGNYRIRGEKPFMIGRREYRLIVSGMLRPEDYEDGGVSAEKLLDPNFEVVTEKKGEQKL